MYNYNKCNTYSAGMKERCRDGCRTSLLIAGVVLVPIFHTSLPPCHSYITIHFMEMIFSTCRYTCLIIELEHHIANPFSCKIEEVVKELKYPQPVPISCLCTPNFNCEVATALEL